MPPNRILIVDDEEAVLRAWQRALKLAGYTVWTAKSADEALRLSDEHSFELVILDYIMPSMDGIELLRRIRRRLPLIRSILISGKVDKDVSEADVNNMIRESIEVDIYLHKPVSNEGLLSSIKELLSREPRDRTWEEIAQQTVDAKKSSRQQSSEASKRLRGILNKKGRKR